MKCKKCKKELPDGSLYCSWCGIKQTVTKQNTKSRGNGTGSIFKRGNTWVIQVTDGYHIVDGKKITKRRTKGGFKTKKDAILALPDFKNNGIFEKSTTLERLWDDWSETAMLQLSESKQTHYKTAHNKMKSILYTDIKLLSIRDLQNVIDKKTKTYYPAKDIKNLLSHLYKRAMAEGIVSTNLSEFLILPELVETERQAFTDEELLDLWKGYSKGDYFVGYILLMIYTGMMPGELKKLKKEMINWHSQVITGCGLKTKKRKETPIILADIILPVLKDLCANSKTDFVLNMSEEKFYEEFHAAMLRNNCRELKPYSCRHTTATALANKNVNSNMIKEIMRHTKFSTTQHYIHIDTAPMLEALNGALK